jgi:citrate synthase
MKKLAMLGLVCGVVAAAIVIARKRQSAESPEEREERQQKKRRAIFEKMQEGMESMPEDFPPVVMFDNVAATRENSERILELLEKNSRHKEESLVSVTK